MNQAGPEIDETELDEELEALEQKDQQATEEKEAEETRKKLAELDNLEQTAKEAARAEQNMDSELEDSIGKMSRMSVEDGSKSAN